MLHDVPRVQFVIRSKGTRETLCEIKKMKKEGRKKELDNAIWADKITRERRKAIDEKKVGESPEELEKNTGEFVG